MESKFSGRPLSEEQLEESAKCWEEIEESIEGLECQKTKKKEKKSEKK